MSDGTQALIEVRDLQEEVRDLKRRLAVLEERAGMSPDADSADENEDEYEWMDRAEFHLPTHVKRAARQARAETLREVIAEVEALQSWADDPGWPFDEIVDTLRTKLTETETTPPGEGDGEEKDDG